MDLDNKDSFMSFIFHSIRIWKVNNSPVRYSTEENGVDLFPFESSNQAW